MLLLLSSLFRHSPSSLLDRKSTRLNSSHANISYAVFCLKKKKKSFLPLHSLFSTHHLSPPHSPSTLFPSRYSAFPPSPLYPVHPHTACLSSLALSLGCRA